MSAPIKILIVEDEMIIGANISLQLSKLGYEVTGILPRGEEALLHIKENSPDLVLLDINLKGALDGIETGALIQKEYGTPFIYLTANTDENHFNRAKQTKPYAFISKPFKKLDLQRAIELALSQVQTEQNVLEEESIVADPYVLSDSIFVRHQEKMVKVVIQDILYIEADRNYCRIHSKDRAYLLVITLKDMDARLPEQHFLRVHRSYIVNISHVKEVANTHVVIDKKAIPMSKSLKQELLKRLQTI